MCTDTFPVRLLTVKSHFRFHSSFLFFPLLFPGRLGNNIKGNGSEWYECGIAPLFSHLPPVPHTLCMQFLFILHPVPPLTPTRRKRGEGKTSCIFGPLLFRRTARFLIKKFPSPTFIFFLLFCQGKKRIWHLGVSLKLPREKCQVHHVSCCEWET